MVSVHSLCHSSRSLEKSISMADQLPFSQRRYRSSYEMFCAMPSVLAIASLRCRCRFGAGYPRQMTPASALRELRRLPVRVQPSRQLVGQLVDLDPRLVEGVAVAQRDGVVLERLVVDRDAPRRADLVLAAVALADRAAAVELGGLAPAQGLGELPPEPPLAGLGHARQPRYPCGPPVR